MPLPKTQRHLLTAQIYAQRYQKCLPATVDCIDEDRKGMEILKTAFLELPQLLSCQPHDLL